MPGARPPAAPRLGLAHVHHPPPTLVDAHTLAWATREDAGSGTPVPWEFLPSAHPWVRCAGPAYDPWQTEQGSTRRSALVSSC